MPCNAPIGIFDSGIGGLSIALAIRDMLPDEQQLYIADSANAPYGDKSEAFILARSQQLTAQLLQQGCKLIVVACNTATVNTIRHLRETFDVPFVGVEPGIKPGLAISPTRTIGVMATQRTISSESFNTLISHHQGEGNVILQACVGLAEKVEGLALNDPDCQALLKKYIGVLLDKGADTLVLGCTHYPLLLEQIRTIAGEHIHIINTSQAVARQVNRLLEQHQLQAKHKQAGSCFSTSGDIEQMRLAVESFWGKDYQLNPLLD